MNSAAEIGRNPASKHQIQPEYVCMYGHTYSKSIDQPGKVASPARGQLNRKNGIFPCPRSFVP